MGILKSLPKINRGDRERKRVIITTPRNDRINETDSIIPCQCGGTRFKTHVKHKSVVCRSCGRMRDISHGSPVKEAHPL